MELKNRLNTDDSELNEVINTDLTKSEQNVTGKISKMEIEQLINEKPESFQKNKKRFMYIHQTNLFVFLSTIAFFLFVIYIFVFYFYKGAV